MSRHIYKKETLIGYTDELELKVNEIIQKVDVNRKFKIHDEKSNNIDLFIYFVTNEYLKTSDFD